MIDNNIYSKTQFSGAIEKIGNVQTRTLNNILDSGRMARMI